MEMINHLGLGHLTMEPICIAYYNWVAKGTKDEKDALLRRMLGPHMDRTLAINRLARLSLLASNELSVDYLLSTGIFICFIFLPWFCCFAFFWPLVPYLFGWRRTFYYRILPSTRPMLFWIHFPENFNSI